MLYGKMQPSRLTEIIAAISTASPWGQCPVLFSNPEGSPSGAASGGWLLDGRYSDSFSEFPQGPSAHLEVATFADVCDILCLLTYRPYFISHRILFSMVMI